MVYRSLLVLALCCTVVCGWSQGGLIRDIGNRRLGGAGGGGGRDSFERRDRFADSITIRYQYLDTPRTYTLDSNINDFYKRFPIPYTYHYLGNPGTAAQPILFQPQQPVGFDPGFHAFDVYKWSLERTRFFNTTRPFTELGYVLGSQTQQIIEVLHTQNIRPYWNFSLNYRLINSPGFYKNQRTNHNNYLFTSWYNSPNKRYNNYFVLLGNKLQSEENGGIRTDTNYLDLDIYDDRFSVPTKLGAEQGFTRNFFGAQLQTGTRYREFNFLMRQQFDLGKKDSLVTDSTVIPLFYPRLRFEHTLRYGKYRHQFRDFNADSGYYKTFYGLAFNRLNDSLMITDEWKEWSNDFSVYQFPDAKNLQQYIKVGIENQILKGEVRENVSLYNINVHGEYRNRTRNQKWDAMASGRLHLAGYNAGDYHAFISLQRLLSVKLGSLQLGFENSSKKPSFIFDERSSFYLDQPQSFLKENTTHLFASVNNPALRLQLGADYFLIGNYLYLSDYYKLQQEKSLFNVLRLRAGKTFSLSKHWNWYSEAFLQQKTGNVDLNVPLLLTRNRVLYEGNLGFKNLNMAFGAEVRYHTPYKANHYSPALGQFSFQDTTTIRNRPDIHALFHFRIRSLTAYSRAENLNTLRWRGSPGFKRQNFGAPEYPYPGLVIRFGVYWNFVN